MRMGCNLHGDIVLRPDGVDESAVWIGEDGSIIEFYERDGVVLRHELKTRLFSAQRLPRVRAAQEKRLKTVRLARKLRDGLALDCFRDALAMVVPWPKLHEFWKWVKHYRAERIARYNGKLEQFWRRARQHQSAAIVKAADGGRNSAVKAGRGRSHSNQLRASVPRYRQGSARRFAAGSQ